MWHCVTVWAVPDTLKDCSAFICSIKKSQKAPRSFEIFDSAHPVAQRHIPKETNPLYKVKWLEHINNALWQDWNTKGNTMITQLWDVFGTSQAGPLSDVNTVSSILVAISIPVHVLMNIVTTVSATATAAVPTTTTTTNTTSVQYYISLKNLLFIRLQ